MRVYDINRIGYHEALALQRNAVTALQDGGGEEKLFLLEHGHVVTKGRNATDSALVATPELLAARDVLLVESDRGGDITYHGPGQLVGYPIVALEEGRRDIRRYVHDLEGAVIKTLADFDLEATRDTGNRGVWIDGRKIASLGIRIARWVTSHGFALNVTTDLDYFSLIVPCGIADCTMTTMTQELGHDVNMDEVKQVFVRHFSATFGRTPLWDGAEEMQNYG